MTLTRLSLFGALAGLGCGSRSPIDVDASHGADAYLLDASPPPDSPVDVQDADARNVMQPFLDVEAGKSSYSCALQGDGKVACWGQVTDDFTSRGPYAKLALGGGQGCGVRADGSVDCFKTEAFTNTGQLSGTYSRVTVGPVICGVSRDGALRCEGVTLYTGSPLGGQFTDVSLYSLLGCAVRVGGEVACWRFKGNPSKIGDRYLVEPATAPAGTFSVVVVGVAHACALGLDGHVACWGNDDLGQASPTAGTYVGLTAGDLFSCALTADGAVACWGKSDEGQCQPPGERFDSISAGAAHTCGLTKNGRVACWGLDSGTPP